MNTHHNQKSPVLTWVVMIVVGAAIGIFLSRTPSTGTQTQVAAGTQTVNNNTTSDHHGGGATTSDDSALNALVDKPLPDIQLADKNGETYTAENFKGKHTVLFFNEGLMCYPACWNQIASFGSDERFNSDHLQAISVVVDPAKDWQRAIDKMPPLAKATTMFDTGANASRQLGILTTASSMHRGSLPGHTYIVLDTSGIVRYVSDDPQMAIANDLLYTKVGEMK